MRTLEDKRRYAREYYHKNKEKIRERYQNYISKYQQRIKNRQNINKVFKQGELVKLSDGRTGVVIKDYKKYIRLNITAGESYYSECFYREDIV